MKKWAVLFLPVIFLYGCSGHLLNVAAVPKDAEVALIPLSAAAAPVSYSSGKRYPAGEYTVRVSNPGYITEDYRVILDKDVRLEALLKRASHRLRVSFTPTDASVRLIPFGGGAAIEYVNGSIPEGEYLLSVSREGYDSYEAVLVLNRNITETVTLGKSMGAKGRSVTPVKEVKTEDLTSLFIAEYSRVGLSPLAKRYLSQAADSQDVKVLSGILVELKTDIDMNYAVTFLEREEGAAKETALAFIYLTGYLVPQDTAKAAAYLDEASEKGGKTALCLRIYALLEEGEGGKAEALAKSSSLMDALPTLKSMSAKDAGAKELMRYILTL